MVTSRDYGGGQVVRSITDADTDSFEILFTIPALFSVAKESLARGGTFSASVHVKVYVQAKGDGYNQKYERTITGISTTNYQFKTPKINLKGSPPWNIKVVKETNGENDFEIKYQNFRDIDKDTSLSSSRGNRLFWTTLLENIEFKNRYPYTAAVGMSISTEAFSSLPTRAYLIKGKTVRIPSNATVDSDGHLVFSGAFNGLLSTENHWTTCPVCCWYDLVTQKGQYGAGGFVDESNLSWTNLFPLCVYANQLITTPDGNKEPRFATNTVIADSAGAFDVLRDMASVFRGMLYWSNNTIQCTADHGNTDGTPVSPVHLYTNSNVIDGLFEYSGTSLKTRSTSIRVRYQDPENLYKTNWVVVENQELINKYGFQKQDALAFGCTSKWQAQRVGRWMMAAQELDGEVVTFSTGLEGVETLPGEIFAVQDQLRAAARIGGRVVTSNPNHIVVDDSSFVVPVGSNPKLTCTMPNNTIETKAISSQNGTIINVTTPFSSAPLVNSIWSIETDAVKLQKFKCVTVKDNGDGQYEVLGVEHNDSVYNVADTGQGKLAYEDVTLFDDIPAKPVDLKFDTKIINNSVNRTLIEWSRGISGATVNFAIRWKVGKGNWNIEPLTSNMSWEKDGLNAGSILTFQVRAVGPKPWEKSSDWVEISGEIPDLVVQTVPIAIVESGESVVEEVPPPNAEDVTLQVLPSDEVILRWKVPNTGSLNVNNLKAIIRHSIELDSDGKYGVGTWANSTKLTEVNASTNYALLPLIEGEYLIKFNDITNGLKSAGAVSAVIDIPDPIPSHIIRTDRQDTTSPPFPGQKEGVFYSDTSGMVGIVLDGDKKIDAEPDIDSIPAIDFTGDRLAFGDYYWNDVLDLGGVFSVEIKRRCNAAGVYPSDLWDSRDELIDRWSDVDGLNADECSAQAFFRASDEVITDDDFLLETGDKLLEEDSDKIMYEDNVLYSDWLPMEKGRYKGRIFQFKVRLTSSRIDQTSVLSELGYTLSVKARTEASSASISSGTAIKAVTFANAFYNTGTTPPVSVSLTAHNMQSGDYYEMSSITRTGFSVHFKNSSGSSVDRTFDYQATGYGKQEV